MTRVLRVCWALARSCHPAPTVAVSCFALVLAVTAGTGPGTAALVTAAVLAGQLSIGWSNDRYDRDRDRSVHRLDKPVAQGELGVHTVDAAIAVAVATTTAASLALGWRAGLVHLGAVACGWLYNLALKGTWLSWLPYASAFGALPAVATFAAAGHPAPAWWAVVAGALLGVTANLTNPLPELAADEATGVRGLPHRLGAHTSLALATGLLCAASAVLALAPQFPPSPFADGALGLAMAGALAGLAYGWRRPTSSTAFYGLIAVVALDVVVVAVVGHGLR